jgi:hypothetical protein
MPDKKPAKPLTTSLYPGSEPITVTEKMLGLERAVQSLYYWVPKAQTLTVAEAMLLLDDRAKLSAIIAHAPSQPRWAALAACSTALRDNPGWPAFEKWANTDPEVSRDADFEAAKELQRRLAQRLRRTFAEIDTMPFADAVRLLEEPESAGIDPSGTPARPPEGEKPAPKPEAPTELPPKIAFPPSETEAATPNKSNLPKRKAPTQKAIDAYRAVKFAGKKQEDVAPRFGVTQGTVSRWIGQVTKWIRDGNILPNLDLPKPKIAPMDPRKLEQGKARRKAHK